MVLAGILSGSELPELEHCKKIDLPKVDSPEPGKIYLSFVEEALHLFDYTNNPAMRFKVDFNRGRLAYRRKGQKKEDLLKAVGDISENTSILDATMGFAEDTILLSELGARLIAVESNPVICCMVEDALRRLEKKPFAIINSNSVTWLEASCERIDIIYLDPMFKEAGKWKGKVKKEMQLLHKITDDSLSDATLLKTALQKAKQKVIVKRPLKAPFLDQKKPSYQISGKSVRFDVYQL